MTDLTIKEGPKEYVYTLPVNSDDVDVFVNERVPVLMRRNGEWFGKIKPCNHCGICCIIKTSGWRFGFKRCEAGPLKDLPVCTLLMPQDNNTYLCNAAGGVPLECLRSYSPTDPQELFYCNVLFLPLVDESQCTPAAEESEEPGEPDLG